MFDQLPHDRGDEPIWHPVSSLMFMAVQEGKASATGGAHAILHHLGDHPALPYGVVERAMKAAATVDARISDLAMLRQHLGEALGRAGLPSTNSSLLSDGGAVREFVLVQGLLSGSCQVPLARWKVGRA